ncbi:MAG: DUF6382 domain-containing protein [Lachnospiraceae bacterium]|nr:DUF6382 domain-containing protein [Lachnospiraceae bacterium]
MYEIQEERVCSAEENWLVLRHLPPGKSFEEEMLSHNDISGVLSMKTWILDGEKRRRYRVDGCCSLQESLLGQKLSGQAFQRLISLLMRRITDARKYLLREESFVLQPKVIFLRSDTGEPELIYCPEYAKPLAEQMRELSDWLLTYLDPQDEQAVYFGYAFHVLSHESGSTVQHMLTAFGGHVAGLPDCSPQKDVRSDCLLRECGDVVPAAGRSENDFGTFAKSGSRLGRLRRRWSSFLWGIAVLLGMIGAALWAMR